MNKVAKIILAVYIVTIIYLGIAYAVTEHTHFLVGACVLTVVDLAIVGYYRRKIFSAEEMQSSI